MKRFQFLAALVALCMLLTLASCATPDTPTPGTSGTSATETPDTPTKPNPEVPTSAPTEESTKPQEPTTAGGNEEDPPKPPKYAWATQGGDGSAESPLIINQENFVAFYNFYLQGGWNSFGDINEHFALGSDIVVNTGDAKTWGTTAPQTVFEKAMCAFNGQLDGKGHSISGLCIKVSGDRAALFHQINKGSTVKNLRVVNSYIELNAGSAGYVTSGTFAGRLHGNIEGCYSDAVVVGIGGSAKTNSLGGIVGMVNENGATVKGCVFAGSVTSENAGAGGIVGKINGGKTGVVISDCLNLGDVKTGFTRSGGILGENSNDNTPNGKIINCINLSKNITVKDGKVGGEIYGDAYNVIRKLTVDTYIISDVRVPGGTVANGVTLDENGVSNPDVSGRGWTFRIVTLNAFLAGGENLPKGWFTAEGCLPCPIDWLYIDLAPYLSAWGISGV